jgi:hypothetical protein
LSGCYRNHDTRHHDRHNDRDPQLQHAIVVVGGESESAFDAVFAGLTSAAGPWPAVTPKSRVSVITTPWVPLPRRGEGDRLAPPPRPVEDRFIRPSAGAEPCKLSTLLQ